MPAFVFPSPLCVFVVDLFFYNYTHLVHFTMQGQPGRSETVDSSIRLQIELDRYRPEEQGVYAVKYDLRRPGEAAAGRQGQRQTILAQFDFERLR